MRLATLAQPSLLAVLFLTTFLQPARADLAEDASNLTPATEAAFAATLIGPTDPLPLPVLTSLPGFQGEAADVTSEEAVVVVTQDSSIAAPVAPPAGPDPPVAPPAGPDPPVAPPADADAPAGDSGAPSSAPVEVLMLEVLEEAPAFSDPEGVRGGLGAAVTAAAARSDERGPSDPVGTGVQVCVSYWHECSLTMHQRDYSALQAIPDPHQPGPCYTARVQAIVHLAIYDALVGITREGNPYLTYNRLPNIAESDQGAAACSAIGWAAFTSLRRLYPEDTEVLNVAIQNYRTLLRDTFPFQPLALFRGLVWGAQVSRAFRSERAGDNSLDPETAAFIPFEGEAPPTVPFQHFPDPTATDFDSDGEPIPQKLYAPHWGTVDPFGHTAVGSLPPLNRPLDPAPLGDAANIERYSTDFEQVLRIGSEESDIRTDEETIIGTFWAYDGALRLGSPVRMYAQNIDVMVVAVLNDPDLDATVMATGYQMARLYAMTHTAMADSTIAAWRDKYEFNLWRPIIGIRYADLDEIAGTAPLKDPSWRQLGAPQTNQDQPGTNPAFPAYPSGHATIGTSAFTVAKNELNIPDSKPFKMMSDEYNGVNTDRNGVARPYLRPLLTVDEAIKQNKDGRVFLGVHWKFDSDTGGDLGQKIAENIMISFPEKA